MYDYHHFPQGNYATLSLYYVMYAVKNAQHKEQFLLTQKMIIFCLFYEIPKNAFFTSYHQ